MRSPVSKIVGGCGGSEDGGKVLSGERGGER
jgi:hypothetical protein